MTNTPHRLLAAPLSRDGEPLVEQIVRALSARIDERVLRPGARLPSIRQFAAAHGISTFTTVASYDRLVAHGYLESRRGAGFFVRARPGTAQGPAPSADGGVLRPPLDVSWLVRNMFSQSHHTKPGTGLLPQDWLDAPLLSHALRAVSRQHGSVLLSYGVPQGFLPLRQQLQLKLEELEIAANPSQLVTTVGVTQALDLVAREFTRPGDTVLVDDPGWFMAFAAFASMGLNVVGVPRLADGPDIGQLEQLATRHKPRLYIVNSVLHNPTSTSMSAAKAFQLLRIAGEHGITVVEDDVYCDLLAPGQQVTRLAALDQLQRVIYLGGFSKTLSANLRVGFIAASEEHARRLAERKLLATLTTSEVGERVIYKILSEGLYRKHADRLRTRLDAVRTRTVRMAERCGLLPEGAPSAGMFLWVDAGRDTGELALSAHAQGILMAPGALFSPARQPSTRMRLNVAALDRAAWDFLERAQETRPGS
ncbi:PLP-dependent aminotransferase family protein [Pseudoduganella sp. GCM10020061]|uniref:aminotransferase-like domain-containing protein n=1 Tax=Pseudoduganella sp. GCM10020061 TaxID=3317345 RepID=UPI00363BF135